MADLPVCFLDVSLGGESLGRIRLRLFSDIVPRTAENFRQFCTGETKTPQGRPMGYKGAKFHRIVKDFMCQGGDFINGDGSGRKSIYGRDSFEDENFALDVDRAGLLAMANTGPNSNSCQFFITAAPAVWLNGKHVVFGEVIDGMDVVRKIENTRVNANQRPLQDVVVTQCGEM